MIQELTESSFTKLDCIFSELVPIFFSTEIDEAHVMMLYKHATQCVATKYLQHRVIKTLI